MHMKGCVNMSKWKFTLPNSKALRQAIEDEDSDAILRQIVIAYEELSKILEEDMTSEIESVRDDIECQAFDEDSVNYQLSNLYDICDARKVWIEL